MKKKKLFVKEKIDAKIFLLEKKSGNALCWDYFEAIKYNGMEIGFAKCKECNAILVASGPKGTSKLKKHCTEKHKPQQSIIQHSTHRRNFNESIKDSIKQAQLNFSVDTLTSFNLHESDGMLEFCNFLIEFGAKHGAVKAEDVLYGRRAIKNEAFQKASEIPENISKKIEGKGISFTSDLWSSKYTNDSFLDVHIVWIEKTELKYCQLAMLNMDEKHTGEAIKTRLLTIIEPYCSVVDRKKITITTDSGANMLKAVEGMNNFRCLCHRLNTSISDGWSESMDENIDISNLNTAVTDLLNSLSKATDIQKKLPVKVKSGPHTRAWRGLITKFKSVSVSLETLKSAVDEKRKKYVYAIDKDHLESVCTLLLKFEPIFDLLEKSKEPSLNYAVTSYYAMKNFLQASNNDSRMVQVLKENLVHSIDMKFFTSLTPLHYAACFLDCRYKSLKFLNGEEKELKMAEIKKEMQSLVPEVIRIEINAASQAQPKPKTSKTDTLLAFEDSSDEECLTGTTLDEEISRYMAIKEKFQNPLEFWVKYEEKLPQLHSVAQKIFSVQASSSLSERIFTFSGKINSKERSRLSPTTLSCLTQLKSARLNNVL